MSNQDTPLTVAYVHQLRAINAALLEALEAAMPTLETAEVPDLPNEGDVQFWLERQAHAHYLARAALRAAKGESRAVKLETCLPPLHIPGCEHRGETA